MAAGSIIIDLLMRTGSFETDTARAEKRLQAFQKQAEKVGKAIGVGITVAVVGAAAAFDQLVKSAADFKDFEETIGASAEDIASLAIAAATAGVSMDSITSATIKLTKGLTGVDDESKAAGAALAALGINIEEFKRLDPVAQYEAVGKALAGFADGAQKTAVAVALFGKSGAEQLRVFKALDEAGGRQVILTQRQIELADAYADKQAKSTATLKAYASALATEALPALTALQDAATEVFRGLAKIDEAGQGLAGKNAVAEFAKDAAIAVAVVIESVIGLGRALRAIGGSFESVIADVKAVAAGAALLQGGGVSGENIQRLQDALKNREQVAKEANQRYIDLWNYDGAQISNAVRKALSAEQRVLNAVQTDPRELARRGRGPAALPQLAFDGAEKAAKPVKDKTTDADRYLERLREQVQKTRELTEAEKVLEDVLAGRFKGAKDFQVFEALRLADEIDRTKILDAENKKLVDDMDQLERKSNELRDAGQRVFDSTRTPAEAYAIELGRINDLLQAGAINSDTYARAVDQLQEKFDENVRRQKELANAIDQSLENGFANNFADFITGAKSATDAFRDFARSVIADLARIASQDIAKQIFGAGGAGSGIGSVLAGLFGGTGSGGGFGTGSSFGNQDYGAFLATGTNYVPHDGFRATLHKGEAVVPAKYNPAMGGAGGSTLQVINPPGMPLQHTYSEERQPDGKQLRKLVISVLQDDAQKGGPGSQALAGAFGLKRQLPRRGI